MAVAQNHLIELLPRRERTKLLAICQPMELHLSDTLCVAGDEMRHVVFPLQGFISLVANTDRHPGLEVGMIGREGMLGAHVALNVLRAPLQALVQGSGHAWQAHAEAFRTLLPSCPVLQRTVHKYLYVLMSQLASSAACLRFHLIAPRLARWLLMSHDRAHSKRFDVTQEFLAYMLGVRRVGVTVAAGVLQDRGLIAYARGHIEVVDRSGLEAAACSCYEADAQAYSRQFAGSKA
ncbi:MAG: Crp/Fnr family transcriptional regulator [Gammaproteobacteria bacterium]|nr:Crp/Fnr family transcriptional regulator [Gammaproteobacteria bacterium]MBU1443960.1 Crp/Fnr family transcriptional regulator [Gammaproteobacteria bacterium]MBU2287244.1 Crp/Fnr family transcriptional regulator [Gammaproteobacteria bacterium]MBU2408664.1 Crp/Fnr family transcriptional regulator [Gammaproteobacteria bacterium]